MDFNIIPYTTSVETTLANISEDIDALYFLPVYDEMTPAELKQFFSAIVCKVTWKASQSTFRQPAPVKSYTMVYCSSGLSFENSARLDPERVGKDTAHRC